MRSVTCTVASWVILWRCSERATQRIRQTPPWAGPVEVCRVRPESRGVRRGSNGGQVGQRFGRVLVSELRRAAGVRSGEESRLPRSRWQPPVPALWGGQQAFRRGEIGCMP
jgi:hypothetical protein